MEGAIEVGIEGLGVRVSLMMGGVLLWVDLVSVACMGVMKLDCCWAWDCTPGRERERDVEGEEREVDLLWKGWGRRGIWGVLGVR